MTSKNFFFMSAELFSWIGLEHYPLDRSGHITINGPAEDDNIGFLKFISSQFFLSNPKAKVYFIDTDNTAKQWASALGGKYYEINTMPGTLSFRPFVNVNDLNERRWAQDWILCILSRENATMNTETGKIVWEALNRMATNPPHQRTMTEFRAHLGTQNAN